MAFYTRLIFIEGTPDRNTVGIKGLYAHGGTYGNATNPIDNNFPILSETAPAGTVSAAFRFILSGHGFDTFQCCEFASHYYDLKLNGSPIWRQQVWRSCGTGELYPQGGSWLFDRANWCPGASVVPYYHALPGITSGAAYNINVNFEPYTVPRPMGNYDASASVVYYGGMNKTVDASIDEIISPSSSQQHFRENPSNNLPVVHIHNSGGTAITSVAFRYGVADSAMQAYTWNGSLASLADTIISLPASTSLAYMSASSLSGTFPFIVAITGVNGSPDADPTNDTMRSPFIVAPEWPDTLVVRMLTSNLGADGNLNTDPSDASWYITNVSGDTVLSRTNTFHSAQYSDTLILPRNGYYDFTVVTTNCVGLHYWEFDGGVPGYAPGYLQVKKTSGANLPMHGYTYAVGTTPAALKNTGEHDDFGCSFSQFFYVGTVNTVSVPAIRSSALVSLYPNPADEAINISFSNVDIHDASVFVINMLGQTVYNAPVTSDKMTIKSGLLAPGIYTILCHKSDGISNLGKIAVAH